VSYVVPRHIWTAVAHLMAARFPQVANQGTRCYEAGWVTTSLSHIRKSAALETVMPATSPLPLSERCQAAVMVK
jgi:hypothetical protein